MFQEQKKTLVEDVQEGLQWDIRKLATLVIFVSSNAKLSKNQMLLACF